MNQGSRLKKLARHLLATTCLTAAAGAAHAATVSEPPDFGNSFAVATSLPVGTTNVVGTMPFGDPADYFKFNGLLPGSAFSFDLHLNSSTGGPTLNGQDSSQNSLFSPITLSGSNTDFFGNGTVPADGMLIISLRQSVESNADYTGSLSAQLAGAPEPGTLATAGIALAGALALRRRLKKQ